jgi:hypothetical protein
LQSRIPLGTPDLDTLKSTLVSNNAHAGWCTVAVFLGLLVEYTILLWPKWKELKRWEKVFTILAGIAIAGGVYGEYFFGSRAADAALQIENISESRVAELKVEAAVLNAKAAGLTKEAQDEQLARVKIEARVAWRRLDPTSAIASHLSQFAGEPALVSYNNNDIEGATFARNIAATLHTAKWNVFEELAFIEAREGPVPFGTNPPLPKGVLVWSTSDNTSQKAALALVKELSVCGFDAVMSADAAYLLGVHPTPARVAISVVQKPEGPQGEFKLEAEREAKQKSKNNAK